MNAEIVPNIGDKIIETDVQQQLDFLISSQSAEAVIVTKRSGFPNFLTMAMASVKRKKTLKSGHNFF